MRRRKLKSIGLYETQVEEDNNAQPTEIAYDNTLEALFGRNCWKAILDDLTCYSIFIGKTAVILVPKALESTVNSP
jgi:hypothetical protein